MTGDQSPSRFQESRKMIMGVSVPGPLQVLVKLSLTMQFIRRNISLFPSLSFLTVLTGMMSTDVTATLISTLSTTLCKKTELQVLKLIQNMMNLTRPDET